MSIIIEATASRIRPTLMSVRALLALLNVLFSPHVDTIKHGSARSRLPIGRPLAVAQASQF